MKHGLQTRKARSRAPFVCRIFLTSIVASGGGEISVRLFSVRNSLLVAAHAIAERFNAAPDSRCQLAGRFATTVSCSRLIRARIACSVSSGDKRTLKQAQPKRARWIRPSANTNRRRVACPQLTHRRGSSPPTPTPPMHLGRCISYSNPVGEVLVGVCVLDRFKP
jgi:hypothetical protein